MWIIFADAAHAAWTWLPIITTIAQALTAVVGLVVAVHRAVRWWLRDR